MQNRQLVVLTSLITRLVISASTCTFFQPDEFYQSLEVAHYYTFGYGKLTWEWLSPKPIRSIIYPALNVPLYTLLKYLHLDDTELLIIAPKILHGILASGTDIALFDLTLKILGADYAPVATFVSLTSFFHGLALSRTLSNSLETTVTIIALSNYPWDTSTLIWRNDLRKFLFFAGLACAIRVTSAVVWVFLFFLLLWRMRTNQTKIVAAITDAVSLGLTVLSLQCIMDSLYYGRATLTPLNFLVTNLSSVSLFYGSSPWHYYLTQGIPILTVFSLPFVLHGAWLAYNQPGHSPLKDILGLVIWTVGIYSLAGHKEWRFIHPLLPLLHIFAAKSLVDLYRAQHRPTDKAQSDRHSWLKIRSSYLWLHLVHIPLVLYMIRFHGRAQVEVMRYLRTEVDIRSAGFLMPCHSTPWQSHLHRPELADAGRLWALGCEPPLQILILPSGENLTEYQDQTDIFYQSPIAYILNHFPAVVDPSFPPSPYPASVPGNAEQSGAWQHTWPQYLIMFGALLREPGITDVVLALGYKRVWHREMGWEGDERRQGGVIVWKHFGNFSR
ncbi:hypothetical protein K474DRAFT_1715428 [Panus rudis PR-1116 ss-1]|nr:hypothetical protein K474DRAFT_1715428 [Panus rudis PR-1116 ss-1]